MQNKKNDEIRQQLYHAYKFSENNVDMIGAHMSLAGSQNYKLDTEDSDFDVQCVYIPTFRALATMKDTSKDFKEDSGIITVRPLNTYVNILMKGNPNAIETLRTRHELYVGTKPFMEEILQVVDYHNDIMRPLFLTSASRMLFGMHNNMGIRRVGSQDRMDKYGYDGKAAAHVVRLYDLIEQIEGGQRVSWLDFGFDDKGLLEAARELKTQSVDKELAYNLTDRIVDVVNRRDYKLGDATSRLWELKEDLETVVSEVMFDTIAKYSGLYK